MEAYLTPHHVRFSIPSHGKDSLASENSFDEWLFSPFNSEVIHHVLTIDSVTKLVVYPQANCKSSISAFINNLKIVKVVLFVLFCSTSTTDSQSTNLNETFLSWNQNNQKKQRTVEPRSNRFQGTNIFFFAIGGFLLLPIKEIKGINLKKLSICICYTRNPLVAGPLEGGSTVYVSIKKSFFVELLTYSLIMYFHCMPCHVFLFSEHQKVLLFASYCRYS